MNTSIRRIDYALLFLLNAVEMILELVAARLMSPYFGNSNFVWTAIIGIILLAASIGNIIGGRLARLKQVRFYVAALMLFAAIYLAAIPLVESYVFTSIDVDGLGVQISSVIGSIIFFLIPATILGVATPVLMKEHIGDNKDDGKESGRITALIAIGSLVGTFVGGFWLIPIMGTRMIFVLLASIVIICSFLISPFKGAKKPKYIWSFVCLSVLSIAMIIISVCAINFSTEKDDADSISIDTEYGRVIIEEELRNGERVRLYKHSGAFSSASFIDEDKKFELVFNYLKKYDIMFDFLDAKDVAMIGGAAYQYPKYYISHFPDKKMDVIEIDPMATKIAKKYFYLDDLLNEYGEDRIGLYNDDGRLFLEKSNKIYDAVLNDAFSGVVPVGNLATVEAAETIKSKISNDGVYISNVLGAISGDKGKFLRSEIKTLRQVFKYVYVIPVYNHVNFDVYTNWMVVATDSKKYVPEDRASIYSTDDDLVLTDDYNPIESLVSTYYND